MITFNRCLPQFIEGTPKRQWILNLHPLLCPPLTKHHSSPPQSNPPAADEKPHHPASEMCSRICLKSLSFLGRLPLCLLVAVCCLHFVLYFGFKAAVLWNLLAVGQRETLSKHKLSKVESESRNICAQWSWFELSCCVSLLPASDVQVASVFLSLSEMWSIHLQHILILRDAASAGFWAGALYLVLADSSGSQAQRPQLFLSV